MTARTTPPFRADHVGSLLRPDAATCRWTTPALPFSTTRSGAPRSAERQHLRYIALFNAALAEKPAGMAVCTHLCRGNFRSGWLAEGSYEHVAEALFNELNVDGFFLEYDDARSGGFAPLCFVPKGKMIVLGLVTTKQAALEGKDQLKRRIDEAAKHVPLEQLCLSRNAVLPPPPRATC